MARGRDGFPYVERAMAVEAARREVARAARNVTQRNVAGDPATEACLDAVRRFHEALRLAYPPGFWDDVERLTAGDPAGLESAIRFLEADPMFFRSGYVKADLTRLAKRVPHDADQRRRLEAVILSIVDRRDGREFRHYCRLARRIAGGPLRGELEARLKAGDPAVRRRARWVLEAIGEPAPEPG